VGAVKGLANLDRVLEATWKGPTAQLPAPDSNTASNGPRSDDVNGRADPHLQPGTGRPPGRSETQMYIHADLALKEKALARTAPQHTTPGRYQPPDTTLAFLDDL